MQAGIMPDRCRPAGLEHIHRRGHIDIDRLYFIIAGIKHYTDYTDIKKPKERKAGVLWNEW